MTIYLTADTHLFHTNIIHHCKRPFKNIKEHDETLINYWNSVVDPEDTVYHLGDFFWKNRKAAHSVLYKLHGKINLILGNHDNISRLPKEDPKKFSILGYYYELKLPEKKGQLIVLCHYAFEVWNKKHYNSFHFHGHSHGNLPKKKNRLDVGVDNCNYKLISLEEATERARED